MKSEWRVTSNLFGDIKMYAAYRLLDISEPDHSGNREYGKGYTENRGEAEEEAATLNRRDGSPAGR